MYPSLSFPFKMMKDLNKTFSSWNYSTVSQLRYRHRGHRDCRRFSIPESSCSLLVATPPSHSPPLTPATTALCFYNSVISVMSHTWNHTVGDLGGLAWFSCNSFKLLGVSTVHFCFQLSGVPGCGCVVAGWTIHPWKHSWVVPSFVLLQTKLPWTFVCKLFCERASSFLQDKRPRVQLLDCVTVHV